MLISNDTTTTSNNTTTTTTTTYTISTSTNNTTTTTEGDVCSQISDGVVPLPVHIHVSLHDSEHAREDSQGGCEGPIRHASWQAYNTR